MRNGILCFMYNPFPTGNVFSFLSYLSLSFAACFHLINMHNKTLGRGTYNETKIIPLFFITRTQDWRVKGGKGVLRQELKYTRA
jgi:hypothetical protein